MIRWELGRVAFILVLASGCSGAVPPRRAAPAQGPPPPVQCTDYPADRQDIVSCRSLSSAQGGEVWARSKEVAATSAISLGFSHIQWLSAETRVELAQGNSPIECKRTWGGAECSGGPYEVPVGFLTVTRFALLSLDEARTRLADPLIPAERRPVDARSIAAASPQP